MFSRRDWRSPICTLKLIKFDRLKMSFNRNRKSRGKKMKLISSEWNTVISWKMPEDSKNPNLTHLNSKLKTKNRLKINHKRHTHRWETNLWPTTPTNPQKTNQRSKNQWISQKWTHPSHLKRKKSPKKVEAKKNADPQILSP